MCYYHFYVLHDKIDCLVLTFCISMCNCVWTDICTLYLFYVSEINIYLSIYLSSRLAFRFLSWKAHTCVFEVFARSLFVS